MHLLPLILLSACTDYELSAPDPTHRPGVDSGIEDDSLPDDDDTPVDDDDDDDDDDTGDIPDDDGPPVDTLDDCVPGTIATWDDGEIYVLSYSPASASGTLHVQDAGWYHVYDYSISESGDSQWNESASIRISNTTFSSGEPLYANCNDDWVVQDQDNYGALPESTRIYVGTFWLLTGDNTLTLNHYCPVYRDGDCADLHITDDPSSTCDSGDANSVHFDGDGVCLVPAF